MNKIMNKIMFKLLVSFIEWMIVRGQIDDNKFRQVVINNLLQAKKYIRESED